MFKAEFNLDSLSFCCNIVKGLIANLFVVSRMPNLSSQTSDNPQRLSTGVEYIVSHVGQT